MRWCPVLLAFAFGAMALSAEPKPAALKGYDPIELVAGREVKGTDDITLVRGSFRYVFAKLENRETFIKNPERFEIQFDGACMRMGPLSGGGHPDRYVVHDQRLYVFASEACRKSFVANPKRFLEVADDEPKGDAASKKRGSEIMTRAVEGLGGVHRLKQLATVETRIQLVYVQMGKETKYKRIVSMAFPGTFATWDDFGGTSRGGWLLCPDAGYSTWGPGEKVGESSRQWMLREMHRQPVAILKAWQNGVAKAVALEPGKVGEIDVDRVAVSVHGAVTTLHVESRSGRIVRIAYRGRSSAGVGNIETTVSDFRDVGGFRLPFKSETTADGKLIDNPKMEIESITVNEKLDVIATKRPETDDDLSSAEMKRLEGMWQLVSATKDGKQTPAETVQKIRVVIKEGKHTVKFGDDTVTKDISFAVNPNKSPKESTDTLPDGKTILGIYKLDGETLTSCVAEIGKDRPTDFAAKEGSGHTLRVFKRIKP